MGVRAVPEEVRQAFEQLKLATGKRLSLHTISGQYYVYEYSSATSARTGKTVVKTYYIGHITKEGKFIAKGERKLAMLEVREGGPKAEEQYDEREAIALRNLSMNGRMSMAKLAKRIGMSVTGTRHFVKRLETKYNIRYFAEVNTLKLGYLRYIALVKFEDKIPTVKEVKEAFEDDPHVALVAMINGIYDMMVIFYLKNTELLANFIYGWRRYKALPSYTAKWYITPLDMTVGVTLPLRRQFTESVIGTELTKSERIKTAQAPLTNIERVVLEELILAGAQEFGDIDRKHGFNPGRSNYAFYKLKEKGIIERVTLTIGPSNLKYNAIFVIQTNNYDKFVENQDKWFTNTISFDKQIINENAFTGDMGIPDSILHIRPIFDETTFHKTKERLDLIDGTETKSMILTDVIIGSLCYRNFDPRYTKIYDTLVELNKISPQNKIDY
jgi:DNA-binding Lrp family transcriptional regulator